MLLLIYLCCIKIACSHLLEPKFQVFTPNKVTIEVPATVEEELVLCKLGVKKNLSNIFDLNCDVTKNQIFINDDTLDLGKGDLLKYVFVFKNSKDYSVKTGSYTFAGEYLKQTFGLQNRLRREVSATKKLLDEDLNAEFISERAIATEETQTDNVNPIESRFGHHHHEYHNNRHHGKHHEHRHSHHNSHRNFELEAEEFDHRSGRGPHQRPYPEFRPLLPNGPSPELRPSYYGQGPPPPWRGLIPPNGGRPDFGIDCTDHRHDSCHNQPDPLKLTKTTTKAHNEQCCPCGQNSLTTSTTATLLDQRHKN